MPIPVECPACEYAFSVPDDYAGKRGKCPECGRVFTAPREGEASAVYAVAAPPLPPAPRSSMAGARTIGGLAIARPKRLASLIDPPQGGDAAASTEAGRSQFGDLDDGNGDYGKNGTAASALASGEAATVPPLQRAKPMSPATFMALAVAVCLIFAGSAALIVHFALRANTHAADGNQDDNSSAAAVSNDRRDKSASGERSGSAKSTLLAQTEIDKAWKQIQPFVVTLSIATPDGERSGTGLLIDTRGWIATTYHLVRDAEQIDVRFAPDAELAASDSPHLVRCTGTVASLPEYDLAIVAVDMSSVASFVEPALNTKDPLNADDVVLACRQPDRSGSWLAACRVHDLIPNEKLPPTSKSILRERGLHDNDELIWIEHKTPISAESSGSPLLNARGEVVGLNTQLSPTSKHGYAIPIQHLVQLKESATGAITPFKPPALVSTNKVETPEVSPPIPATEPAATPASDPTPDRDPLNYVKYIRAVHQECKAFDFSPSTAAQYEQLQRLARCVNTAKEFEEKERVDEGMRILVGETAQEVLNELSETPWPIDATLAEANNFAADAMNVPGNAVFAYLQITVHPRVSAPLDGQPTFIAQLVGTDQTVVLPTRLNPSDLKKGSRWLVLGMHDESIRLQIGVGDEIDERVVPLIRAKYLIGEPQATDAPDRR